MDCRLALNPHYVQSNMACVSRHTNVPYNIIATVNNIFFLFYRFNIIDIIILGLNDELCRHLLGFK